MDTVIFIDGGLGRVISAIPALLKFEQQNKDKEWIVVAPAWAPIFWSIPELQDRVYTGDEKGIFDNLIKNAKQFIKPEPYHNPRYYRQEIGLVQAFDQEINSTFDHDDLSPPILKFTRAEKLWAQKILSELRQKQGKKYNIVIQPFGRGVRLENNKIIDDGARSFHPDSYILLVKKLATKYNLIFFGDQPFQLSNDTYTAKLDPNTDIRMWASLINASDYFIGVDSSGQHMARATNTPGTVFFGSTFPINTSYTNWFNIIEKTQVKKYSPIRICGLDCVLADRINNELMNYNSKDFESIIENIDNDISQKLEQK
jgi:ADP-heptose:LPS heptosyltransferase